MSVRITHTQNGDTQVSINKVSFQTDRCKTSKIEHTQTEINAPMNKKVNCQPKRHTDDSRSHHPPVPLEL